MNSKLIIADICRLIARVISIPLVPIAICYLLFVGLQIPSEGGNIVGFFIYMFFLLAMLAGLVIAWWREGLGSIIALVGMGGSFILSWIFGSREILEEASPLAGPIHLLFALFIPGYHLDVSPIAKSVPLISWVLLITPICLFFISGLIRRKSPKLKSPDEIAEEDQERLKIKLLELLAEGLDNLDIANELGISGIQTSLLTSKLFEEYEVNSRVELIERLRERLTS